jgi:O-antigen/teichoic acid export membrane protein
MPGRRCAITTCMSFATATSRAASPDLVNRRLVGGLLFSGLSNFMVIPLFGHRGAASTTLLAEIGIFLLQARILKKVLPGFKIMDVKPGLWAAVLAMAACAWALRGFNWAAALAVSSGLYLALIFLFGVVTGKDVDALRKIFRRKQAAE